MTKAELIIKIKEAREHAEHMDEIYRNDRIMSSNQAVWTQGYDFGKTVVSGIAAQWLRDLEALAD